MSDSLQNAFELNACDQSALQHPNQPLSNNTTADANPLQMTDVINAIAQTAQAPTPNPSPAVQKLANQLDAKHLAKHLLVVIVPGLSGLDYGLDCGFDTGINEQTKQGGNGDNSGGGSGGGGGGDFHAQLIQTNPAAGLAGMLTSWATGLMPSQHGVLGSTLYLPNKQTGVNVWKFTNPIDGRDLTKNGLLPSAVFREMPLWVDTQRDVMTYVTEPNLNKSAWAQYLSAYRGLKTHTGLQDALDQARQHIVKSQGPTLCVVVLDESIASEPDGDPQNIQSPNTQLQHSQSQLTQSLLTQLHQAASAFDAHQDQQSIWLGTGGLIAEPKWIKTNRQVMADAGLLAPVCGEPRCPQFFVQPGKDDQFHHWFNQTLGDCFSLITQTQAIELGLFTTTYHQQDAPVEAHAKHKPETQANTTSMDTDETASPAPTLAEQNAINTTDLALSRMGDYIAIATDPKAAYQIHKKSRVAWGGLTPRESTGVLLIR